MPKEAPQSPRLRRKCQRKRRSRQGCGGNAKGSAAVAKVAAEMPKEAAQSPRLRRNAKGGGVVAKIAAEMPNEVPQSAMLRLKRQMRRGNRQCCALNAKWGAAVAIVVP